MLRYNRKSLAFGHCLSTSRSAEVVTFNADGLLGGIVGDDDVTKLDYDKADSIMNNGVG